MPLVKKRLSVAAGATSDQVLAGSTYEYVDQGTQIIVAAAVDTAGTAPADTTVNLVKTQVYLPWLLASLLVGKVVML